MNPPGLKITYWAYAEQVGVEDLIDVENFKAEIDERYSSLIKVYPHGRGGDVFQFIIEFFANLTLKEYLAIVAGYIGGKSIDKVLDPVLDAYLFNPLKRAYRKLKQKNPDLGIYSLSFDLSDTKIIIYYLDDDSVLENLDIILKEIGDRYKDFRYFEDFPTEIHIPALKDVSEGNIFYRPPFEMEEHIDLRAIKYNEGYWGIKTFKYGLECIYSLKENKLITDTAFYTIEDLYNRGKIKQ